MNNDLNLQNNNEQENVQNQEVLNNENIVNNQEIIKKKNNNIIIIFVIILIILVIIILGYFVMSKKDNTNKENKKDIVKTIYFYESIDREYPKRISVIATDDKKDTESDEFHTKKILNTYECETECELDYGITSLDYLAIYDGKLIQYDEVNNTFENIKKTKEYKLGEYKYTTYGDWIVGEYKDIISLGEKYNYLRIKDNKSSDSSYDIEVSLNSLEKNAYLVVDRTNKTPIDEYVNSVKASIYKDDELFFEKNISEYNYPSFDIKDGFYLVHDCDDPFAITEDKNVIDNYMYGNNFSVYNGKLIISYEKNIFVYDKSGALVSKTSYTDVGSVYDNYAFIINNGELHLINALDNQIIYNFGTIKSSEQFYGTDESDYVIDGNSKKIWVFLEDSEDPQYMIGAYENGDNVFGRRFTYDFNTGEGSIEKSSAFSEQNT